MNGSLWNIYMVSYHKRKFLGVLTGTNKDWGLKKGPEQAFSWCTDIHNYLSESEIVAQSVVPPKGKLELIFGDVLIEE